MYDERMICYCVSIMIAWSVPASQIGGYILKKALDLGYSRKLQKPRRRQIIAVYTIDP